MKGSGEEVVDDVADELPDDLPEESLQPEDGAKPGIDPQLVDLDKLVGDSWPQVSCVNCGYNSSS